MKVGMQKAVQVRRTDVWYPDADYDPDYGIVDGTDGQTYCIRLEDNDEPAEHAMLILELLDAGFEQENIGLWTIVKE